MRDWTRVVAALARKRPAVADHKIGGFFQKRAPRMAFDVEGNLF
jgi:hypothetical protein